MENSYRCPFAKALLSRHSGCQYAQSFHIAERHGMQCTVPDAQLTCEAIAKALHEHSRFALGVTKLPQQMTSNMELRIQCGGINGIAAAVDGEYPAPVEIYTLIEQGIKEFETIEQFPYSTIAQAISQWKPRRRGRSKT